MNISACMEDEIMKTKEHNSKVLANFIDNNILDDVSGGALCD